MKYLNLNLADLLTGNEQALFSRVSFFANVIARGYRNPRAPEMEDKLPVTKRRPRVLISLYFQRYGRTTIVFVAVFLPCDGSQGAQCSI